MLNFQFFPLPKCVIKFHKLVIELTAIKLGKGLNNNASINREKLTLSQKQQRNYTFQFVVFFLILLNKNVISLLNLHHIRVLNYSLHF